MFLPSEFNLLLSKLVEPEVVATSPYRIKSPVPVCCGLDSLGEFSIYDIRWTRARRGSTPLVNRKSYIVNGRAICICPDDDRDCGGF